ncbi:MAG: ATPase component of transporter with duplicated ATPase domain [Clostridiales bacterium]|nr:ATPase component of transporter with duplicated ATPase domain [Clostridiales bacterium]
MILLTTDKVTKSYSEKVLLKDISFSLNDGDKVGVIGINGTGKSTFLKIIAGLEDADSGSVTKTKGVRIGYLPQNPVFEDNVTVLEQVFKGNEISNTNQAKEYEAKSILNKLGITDFDKNVSQLSGGEKKRIAIATALINPCEILIMDEPTNHIDSEMVMWLEKYLEKYTGAIIMVTHDRYFLDRVTNKIVEISDGSLYSYSSNYSEYLRLKAERIEMEISTERKNMSLYRKELDWIMRGPRARATKSKSRIDRFEELENRKKPTDDEKIELNSVSSRLGKKTIEVVVNPSENDSRGLEAR